MNPSPPASAGLLAAELLKLMRPRQWVKSSFVFIGLLFGGIVFVIMIPFAVLSMGPALIDIIANNTVQARDIFSIAGSGICLGLIGAAVNAIMIAFRSTAVTLAYKEFTQKTA